MSKDIKMYLISKINKYRIDNVLTKILISMKSFQTNREDPTTSK